MPRHNKPPSLLLLLLLLLSSRGTILPLARAQVINRAPHFVFGGDMARLAVSESTPVGAPGSRLHYSISGDYFGVERETGVVLLRKPLDREVQDIIEVIVSITGNNDYESVAGSEPNTVSLRREIAVLDENDNAPVYHGRPYAARVPESADLGELLLPEGSILVTDRDGGVNADVRSVKLAEGRYDVRISLARPLDYERRNSYLINLLAVDGAGDPAKRLQAKATVAVDVLDVQDQPPTFVNAPYSVALAENSPAGLTVLTIKARDGDTGDARPVWLSIENEAGGYFELELAEHGDVTHGHLVTTNVSLDREDEAILQNGGVYGFEIRATELLDGELTDDQALATVTLVVTDVDDMVPSFNEDRFVVAVSEDIGTDTPLPGLNMFVQDDDVGDNARYRLALRDAPRYHGVSRAFDISPEEGQGRTPVVIRTLDPRVLDYDVPGDKQLEFQVVALVNGQVVSFSTVHIQLLDANDHSPDFSQQLYHLTVPEDAEVGLKFGEVRARDLDSGAFGQLTYVLRGFGVEKFRTDPRAGGLFVARSLDYEDQKSYSLTLEARDGGERVSTVSLLVEVEDVNDNEPRFETSEYTRIVREAATSFDPQMFVRASDADGPAQGDGRITYSISQHNSMNDNVFKIQPETGELVLTGSARSTDTERGIYELVVRATDHGSPAKFAEARVYIRVGVPGNQKPVFRGNYKSSQPGPNVYRAKIPENAAAGTEIIRVQANDPDGRDNLLRYRIHSGARDNFAMDPRSGLMTVAPEARLDLESGGPKYEVIVHAVDSGEPIRETATTTVTVEVLDVNNKPPAFENSSYTAYVSERAKIGERVIEVRARDPDSDAEIEYSIVEPSRALDKTGATVQESFYDYRGLFRVNKTTGSVTIAKPLNYQRAAVIIMTLEARDLNAAVDKDRQLARVELSVFVQAFSDDNPTFTNQGWSANNPWIRLTIPEEQPLGTTLLMLQAKEPQTGYAVQRFEMVRGENDEAYFNVGVNSGNVVLSKRLDYESLKDNVIRFKVRALTRDFDITQRMSEANIEVTVEDVNDNGPEFAQPNYKVSVMESDRPPKVVLTVKATDLDSANTEAELKRGYGVVGYSLTGENANLFEIDPVSGTIRIAPNVTLDRERQSVLKMQVIAQDMPQGGANRRVAQASITVDVLDVNDNAPAFAQESYTSVVPENAAPGVSIVNVTARDPDEAGGGTIHYEIIDEGEASGLVRINHTTGEIRSSRALTGKGRTEPYAMRVRAQDQGEPALYTDVPLILYIGDVVSNDGVPLFVRPGLDEIAHVSENSSIGSPVFQVLATDPDDPQLPNGKIVYKFLEDGDFGSGGGDAAAFHIDPRTGLITSRVPLDREEKENYTLILVAQDLGEPPQQATRVLQVRVLDIDDHKPHFKRQVYGPPLEFSVKEETPIGTRIGIVQAIDEDIGENGQIDYAISHGNEAGFFAIERLANNSGLIKSTKRLDRETSERHLLTIRCFKYTGKQQDFIPKPYNRQEPAERQVLVRIIDIDDNRPRFDKDNVTIGVRLNVPIDTSLITLEARDVDVDALPINYIMGDTAFVALNEHHANPNKPKRTSVGTGQSPPLALNPVTGEVRTTKSLVAYADGYLEVPILANNSLVPGRETNVTLRVFLLRDRDMLKFVFSRPPTEVRERLEAFEREVREALLLPQVQVNVYDTQFYAKEDSSLDFSATSSCFQMVGGREAFGLAEMRQLLLDPDNRRLKDVYERYHVDGIQNCAVTFARTDASATQLWVLAIAVLVGFATVTASCTICCMHSKFKRRARHARLRENSRPTLSYISSGPALMSAGSHASLGGPPVTPGPAMLISSGHHHHEGPYEWGNTIYHPSTLSRP
ncbi:unnamed protein product [Trichogramma brassicae]|uniref:Cadherin domain-containing protein n=1 Tax=Trichogramma brassicae TaxID=86971 RepID=A0A6H5IMC7_9HYME|nr:unnamed protein product [Trichogramma brassicae]